MNRTDIQLLQAIRGYPALSILLPTHRTAPANRQDPIRVKNLVRQAQERLLAEFSQRDLAGLFARLDALVNTIDYRYTLDGLALFVNADIARSFMLPFPLKERVVVDETFATRDLVFALNRTPRYWVLALSEQPTRLFEGIRETLIEVTGNGFPIIHTGPGGQQAIPNKPDINRSAYRDEHHRLFFRQVDEAFKPFMVADPLPLAVVGVDRYLAFFREVSAYTSEIVTTMTGNHDKTTAHELGKLVWPLVEGSLAARRKGYLQELDAAVGAQKYVSTIGEVWRLGHEGRGALLLVEEDFHYPARVDASGMHLTPADDPSAPDVLDDAVDDLIETVLAHGGRVAFVDNGALTQHQRIALVLRY